MPTGYTWIRGKIRFTISLPGLILGLLLFGLLLAQGCTSPPNHIQNEKQELPAIVQDGITLPHFPTAVDQLNYARSGLIDKKKKMAAFRAVCFLFQENRLECGKAAMGLAYLHLEPEYRFATPLEIRRSANDFESILLEFSLFPEIQAKALWYLGWIYAELLDLPEKGIDFYWQIVNHFPDVPMNISPPEPWVNLVYPAEEFPKQAKPSAPKKYWAQVALLEIVRNSTDPSQASKAFDILCSRFFTSQATGLAIKHMLTIPALWAHALEKVEPFLEQTPQNPYLARDIIALADKAMP